jgi:hypothetical protein
MLKQVLGMLAVAGALMAVPAAEAQAQSAEALIRKIEQALDGRGCMRVTISSGGTADVCLRGSSLHIVGHMRVAGVDGMCNLTLVVPRNPASRRGSADYCSAARMPVSREEADGRRLFREVAANF